MRVQRREIDRLMLMIPPRHGKSELASKRFPAWSLGQDPAKQFISVSATAELASDFGRDVRNLISSQEYKNIFPETSLAEDSSAKGKWHTNQGGIYYSVGVGGSILGRGGHDILIDDPFSSMEDARSELVRKKVWDWYQGTLYNRLMPGGAIVIINHRMHEEDLIGRLLDQQAAGGDAWEVVELGIDNKCTPLWPEAYSREALERIRANTTAQVWAALYQQKPAPDEGDYFKRDWFRWYTTAPKHLRIYGASDYAVTAKGGDYTVHIVVGIDADDNLYILDVWREQTESDVWIEALLELAKRYQPLKWAEEQGQIIKSLGPFIKKRQKEQKVYFQREQYTSVSDKPTRARSFQARCSMGKVYLPKQAPWLSDFLGELLAFPVGKTDDMIDTCGLVGRMLDKMISAKSEKPKAQKQDRWDKAFKTNSNTSDWRSGL
ncbi:MAG: phage terminase large subunit [Pseudomonadota bacterium]